jgi:hypothetical protein
VLVAKREFGRHGKSSQPAKPPDALPGCTTGRRNHPSSRFSAMRARIMSDFDDKRLRPTSALPARGQWCLNRAKRDTHCVHIQRRAEQARTAAPPRRTASRSASTRTPRRRGYRFSMRSGRGVRRAWPRALCGRLEQTGHRVGGARNSSPGLSFGTPASGTDRRRRTARAPRKQTWAQRGRFRRDTVARAADATRAQLREREQEQVLARFALIPPAAVDDWESQRPPSSAHTGFARTQQPHAAGLEVTGGSRAREGGRRV